MNFDNKNENKSEVALKLQTISSDTTTVGEVIDTKDCEALMFMIQSGTITTGTITPVINESDSISGTIGAGATLSGGSSVDAGDLVGTLAAATFAVTDDDKIKTVGYIGKKRYVCLSVTTAGSTFSGTVGAQALKSHNRYNPISQ